MGQARVYANASQISARLFARFLGALKERVNPIWCQSVAAREKTNGFSLRNAWSCGHFTEFSDDILVAHDRMCALHHPNDHCELANWLVKRLNYMRYLASDRFFVHLGELARDRHRAVARETL